MEDLRHASCPVVDALPPTLFVTSECDALLSGTVNLHRAFLRAAWILVYDEPCGEGRAAPRGTDFACRFTRGGVPVWRVS